MGAAQSTTGSNDPVVKTLNFSDSELQRVRSPLSELTWQPNGAIDAKENVGTQKDELAAVPQKRGSKAARRKLQEDKNKRPGTRASTAGSTQRGGTKSSSSQFPPASSRGSARRGQV